MPEKYHERSEKYIADNISRGNPEFPLTNYEYFLSNTYFAMHSYTFDMFISLNIGSKNHKYLTIKFYFTYSKTFYFFCQKRGIRISMVGVNRRAAKGAGQFSVCGKCV